jgi:N-formylglutamate amidohydrolase
MTTAPPFSNFGSERPTRPVVLSVTHAGRNYPAGIHQLIRPSLDRTMSLEDRYADLLTSDAESLGFSGLIARTPRLWIDLNRAEEDMDPDMFVVAERHHRTMTVKARGGLGLVPRRTGQLGDIWRQRITQTDIARRIAVHHRPYHEQLAAMLERAERRFGMALLLDIHSMPPIADTGDGPAPDIVIGDRFGRSAGSRFTDRAAAAARNAGFKVAINAPYAGGHVLERHGSPEKGRHALQIEVDRRLYLDAALREPGPGLDPIRRLITAIATALEDELIAHQLPIAAE